MTHDFLFLVGVMPLGQGGSINFRGGGLGRHVFLGYEAFDVARAVLLRGGGLRRHWRRYT